jgi:hypothetical protein
MYRGAESVVVIFGKVCAALLSMTVSGTVSEGETATTIVTGW